MCVFFLLCASPAFGQAGFIGLYSDSLYQNCNLTDPPVGGPGLQHVYVVHEYTPGATASRWRVVNYRMGCAYLSEASPFVTIGDAFNGISVAYGSCLASYILLLDISYYCSGTSPDGAMLYVAPDLAAPSGTIEVVNCATITLVGNGACMTINDPWCDCPPPWPAPLEETSWGNIKALYR